MRSPFPIIRNVTGLFLLLSLTGCATSFTPPDPDVDLGFQSSKTKTAHGITATAAVLGREESERVFGLPLYDEGIQPVWVRIANRDDIPYYFLPTGIDHDYFPPLEVAYRFRSSDDEVNRQIEELFRSKFMGRLIEPDHEMSGFVFTNLDLGDKNIYVRLIAEGNLREIPFFLHVPDGIRADFEEVPFDSLYDETDIEDLELGSLRTALSKLPCCTTDKEGGRSGDPLNLVLVGHLDEIKAALARRKWDDTEAIYGGSIRKTMSAFFFRKRYRYSPVSPLYAFGRPQDLAMQRIRDSINARNHLRLWMTPMRHEGRPVWIGQISRDVGVRFTTKTWNLTTHAIAADVDEMRDYLIEDLLLTGRVEAVGFVEGVGEAEASHRRTNLTGDLYFTDGLRAVIMFTSKAIPPETAGVLPWSWPPKTVTTKRLSQAGDEL
jgi:hypothetical protein